MPRRTPWLVVAAVAALLCSPASAREAVVVVANADEVVASLPDPTVGKDLLEYLDEDDLWRVNFHKGGRGDEPEAKDLMSAAIVLATPGDVTTISSSGTRFEVGPVEDFDRFVDAIDYGKVVARDDAKWAIRVEVDPAAVSLEKLQERITAAVDPPGLVANLLPSEDDNTFDQTPRFRGLPGRSDAEPRETLVGSFEPGDYVELDLGRKPYAARVEELDRERFGKRLLWVALHDPSKLVAVVRDRRLKKRLAKAETVGFWAPQDKLRRLDGPPRPKPEARTWSDITGRFRIEATYSGREGEAVALEKADGSKIRVPLGKLSEADRQYVEGLASAEANPFEGAKPAQPRSRSLRPDWSGVRTIRGKEFSRWEFNPPSDPPPVPARLAAESLAVDTPNDPGPFGESLDELHVSADGAKAVAVIKAGSHIDPVFHLQRLDFAAGRSEPQIACPAGSVVLDVDPAAGIVLLTPKRVGANASSRLYVRRMAQGRLDPVCDWDTEPPKDFHKTGVRCARLLADGHVLTHHFGVGWTLWDARTARAEWTAEIRGSDPKNLTVGPRGRFLFFGASRAVSIIDALGGQHVATVPHNLALVSELSVDPALDRLAISSAEFVGVLDLTTGDLLHALQGGLIRRGDIEFVGDLMLIDNEFLVAPQYPVLLWQYAMNDADRGKSHAQVRGDRLYYASRSAGLDGRGRGGWTIASIPTPHDTIRQTLASLGSLDDLVILQPGDTVTVASDTDLGEATEARFEASLTAALEASGFEVVEPAEATGATKRAVVVCRRAAEPIEIEVHDRNAKPPADADAGSRVWARMRGPRLRGDDWQFQTRTIRPYESSVTIQLGDEILWRDEEKMRPARWSIRDRTKRSTRPSSGSSRPRSSGSRAFRSRQKSAAAATPRLTARTARRSSTRPVSPRTTPARHERGCIQPRQGRQRVARGASPWTQSPQ